jgi:hypothetical protein
MPTEIKALWITTNTNEVFNHVKAWESVYGKTVHKTFNHMAIRNDWMFIEWAQEFKPDIIFYIGANLAPGNPKKDILGELRKFAPTVLLCSDAADEPWHPVLDQYRKHSSFDLMVSLDGSHTPFVDMATLTPVSPELFNAEGNKDIHCGFSGTVGKVGERAETIGDLKRLGFLTVRPRESFDGYNSHAFFMRRSRMILNTSLTGSGKAHHIKGRVLEAGWAGCALLEMEGSPIREWFPDDCYFTWRSSKEAAAIIYDASDDEISHRARRLSEEVRKHYSPKSIYDSILKRIGNVRIAQQG